MTETTIDKGALEAQLVGCPFCGRDPDTENAPARGTDIYCAHEDCGGARIFVGVDETERHGEEAIHRWNRRAALPVSREAVGVKALEWGGNGDVFYTTSVLGTYTVKHDGDEPEEWSYNLGNRMLGSARDESEAKAAAQEHHDKRILSALASHTVDTREADGWMEWNPPIPSFSKCPVGHMELVDFRRRNDDLILGVYADAFNWGRYDKPLDTDIIAYRLVPQTGVL
jgi:hypothetical protein